MTRAGLRPTAKPALEPLARRLWGPVRLGLRPTANPLLLPFDKVAFLPKCDIV